MNSRQPQDVLHHGALYTGWIRHRRFAPVMHEFRLPIAMLCVNLDHWDTVFDRIPLWSSRRFCPGWLREADYLAHVPGKTLRDRTRHAVASATGHTPTGPILLLTHPRYFGFGMNPISCLYCYSADGTNLEYLVAEVTNTPWRERIAYVIPCRAGERKQHAQFAKQMHVSPFNPMTMRYSMHFNTPDHQLYIQLENRDADNNCVTDATLVMHAAALERRTLQNLLWHYPLMTVQVGIGIYWQALKLWWKGVPVHGHRPVLTPVSPQYFSETTREPAP